MKLNLGGKVEPHYHNIAQILTYLNEEHVIWSVT